MTATIHPFLRKPLRTEADARAEAERRFRPLIDALSADGTIDTEFKAFVTNDLERQVRELVTPGVCAVFLLSCFALWGVTFSTTALVTRWQPQPAPAITMAEVAKFGFRGSFGS